MHTDNHSVAHVTSDIPSSSEEKAAKNSIQCQTFYSLTQSQLTTGLLVLSSPGEESSPNDSAQEGISHDYHMTVT